MLQSKEYLMAVQQAKEEIRAELLAAKMSKHGILKDIRKKYIRGENGKDGELTQIVGVQDAWKIYENARIMAVKALGFGYMARVKSEQDRKRLVQAVDNIMQAALNITKGDVDNAKK